MGKNFVKAGMMDWVISPESYCDDLAEDKTHIPKDKDRWGNRNGNIDEMFSLLYKDRKLTSEDSCLLNELSGKLDNHFYETRIILTKILMSMLRRGIPISEDKSFQFLKKNFGMIGNNFGEELISLIGDKKKELKGKAFKVYIYRGRQKNKGDKEVLVGGKKYYVHFYEIKKYLKKWPAIPKIEVKKLLSLIDKDIIVSQNLKKILTNSTDSPTYNFLKLISFNYLDFNQIDGKDLIGLEKIIIILFKNRRQFKTTISIMRESALKTIGSFEVSNEESFRVYSLLYYISNNGKKEFKYDFQEMGELLNDTYIERWQTKISKYIKKSPILQRMFKSFLGKGAKEIAIIIGETIIELENAPTGIIEWAIAVAIVPILKLIHKYILSEKIFTMQYKKEEKIFEVYDGYGVSGSISERTWKYIPDTKGLLDKKWDINPYDENKFKIRERKLNK